MTFFPKGFGIFSPKFYMPIIRSYVRPTTNFYSVTVPSTLTKLCHIKRDHQVHIMCAKCPPSAETHAGIFPKQLGIFSPNFARLLHIPIYARVQIFIQLSPTTTKLCHIKCDHPASVSADGGHFENMMVVAFNME